MIVKDREGMGAKFWDHVEAVAYMVKTWPGWMQGGNTMQDIQVYGRTVQPQQRALRQTLVGLLNEIENAQQRIQDHTEGLRGAEARLTRAVSEFENLTGINPTAHGAGYPGLLRSQLAALDGTA